MPILGILASSRLSVATSYESIATTTVGAGGSSSISFSSIPSTYTHLQIRGIQKFTGSGEARLRMNSDTGTNYSQHILYGDGASAAASGTGTQSDINWTMGASSTSQFTAFVIDILDYRNANKNKTVRALSGVDQNGSGSVYLSSGAWLNTAAVTSIELRTTANNFAQYSHFALYGIKSA